MTEKLGKTVRKICVTTVFVSAITMPICSQ